MTAASRRCGRRLCVSPQKFPPADRFRLDLAGIEPEARYLVTITDDALRQTQAVLDGEALCCYDVSIPVPHASAVLEYRKCED